MFVDSVYKHNVFYKTCKPTFNCWFGTAFMISQESIFIIRLEWFKSLGSFHHGYMLFVYEFPLWRWSCCRLISKMGFPVLIWYDIIIRSLKNKVFMVLSWWQPPVPPVMTKLASWQIFGFSYWKLSFGYTAHRMSVAATDRWCQAST